MLITANLRGRSNQKFRIFFKQSSGGLFNLVEQTLGDTNLISSITGATDPEFLKLEIIILFLFPTDPNKKFLGKTFLFCN